MNYEEDRIQQKNATAKANKPKAAPAGTVGGQIGNQNARKDFGGDGNTTISKIAKKLNPLTGLDTTDLGTTVSSAAAKAKGRMKNLDKFRLGK